MQFDVESGYQLSICSGTKGNLGNPGSIWPVAGPSGCKLTSNKQSGLKYANSVAQRLIHSTTPPLIHRLYRRLNHDLIFNLPCLLWSLLESSSLYVFAGPNGTIGSVFVCASFPSENICSSRDCEFVKQSSCRC
jgi:hypothetical protein